LAEIADVPLGVVTLTSTVSAASGGETALMVVELTTVKLMAAFVPKWTAVAPVKLVPVIVTVVPPDVGPSCGITAVTVGGLPTAT
jgi:hypothetical protein